MLVPIPRSIVYKHAIDVTVERIVQVVQMKRVVVLEINSLASTMLKLMRQIFWTKSAYLIRNAVMGKMIVKKRVTRHFVRKVNKHYTYIK